MALNTPYKRVDLNVNPNYASMAQKDPWFALGYALGEGYWNNYNARGEKKATETAEQMLNNAVKHGDPNAGVLTNEDLIGKYARPDKKQQILDAAIQLPELKYDKDGKEVKGTGNQQATIDKGLLKWGYLDDKYANSPNPVGDSAAAQKLVNGTELLLSNANMGAFDAQKFKLALDKQLMADGRNARQREAAWAAIQPMIAEKKAEYNNQVSNQLYDAYKLAYADGNYGLAEQYAMQLNKFDPNLSKYLLTKERDRYQNELADQRADKAYMRKLGLAGTKNSGAGNSVGVNAAKAMLADEETWLKANPDKTREDYPRAGEAESARKYLANTVGHKDEQPNKPVSILQKHINKYIGLGALEAKDALKNDKELIQVLKDNPSLIHEFEAQTGIMLPRKQ